MLRDPQRAARRAGANRRAQPVRNMIQTGTRHRGERRHASIGALAGAVLVIAQRSVTDWVTGALALATAGLLWRFKKLPEPVIVAAAAAIGLVVYPLMKHA